MEKYIFQVMKFKGLPLFFLTFFISFIVISETTYAQLAMTNVRPRPEYYLQVGGGLAGVAYPVFGGSSQLGLGGQAGFGFNYFFAPNWGISVGMDVSLYNAKATLINGLMCASPAADADNVPFEWRILVNGYEEKQTASYVTIPIVGQFQYPMSDKAGVYVRGGFKFGIPVAGKYESKAQSLATSGYYPYSNREIINDPANGFGNYANWSSSGDFGLGVSYTLTAEVGVKFHLTGMSFLYFGLYLDNGLNNVLSSNKNPLVDYQPGQGMLSPTKGNSMLTVNTLVDQARLLAYGVNLRLAFNSGGNKTSSKVRYYKCCPYL